VGEIRSGRNEKMRNEKCERNEKMRSGRNEKWEK